MMKRRIAVGFTLMAGALFAQTPAFEVASIKPAPPITALAAQFQAGKLHVGMSIDGARVDIGFMSLADLIPVAFRVKPYQVSGPSWMSSERFDILAKLPEGASKDQVPEMLQALLTERFKLAFHRDTKEHPIYALVVGKNGLKLKESSPDADVPPPAGAAADNGPRTITLGAGDNQVRINQSGDGKGMVVTGGQNGTMRMTPSPDGGMHMEASKTTMTQFAEMLSRFVDRPVMDMTELKGNYQLGLTLSRDDLLTAARAAAGAAGVAIPGIPGPPGAAAGGQPVITASDPSGGAIFQTVQQLGLRLEPRKAPLETIVIDHLEKTPTDN